MDEVFLYCLNFEKIQSVLSFGQHAYFKHVSQRPKHVFINYYSVVNIKPTLQEQLCYVYVAQHLKKNFFKLYLTYKSKDLWADPDETLQDAQGALLTDKGLGSNVERSQRALEGCGSQFQKGCSGSFNRGIV